VTVAEWSKAYRQTRDEMNHAANVIAEVVVMRDKPTDALIKAYRDAQSAHYAIINTKIKEAA
jgi:hypothetical protein